MEFPFQQWLAAKKFNQCVANSTHHYVILLTKTQKFNIEQDLKYSLNITKKPLLWFVKKFKQHGIQVEYATLFSQKDIQTYGPLSTTVSNAIVRNYLQSKYSESVVFVCSASFAKKIPFKTISPETLVYRISEQGVEGFN